LAKTITAAVAAAAALANPVAQARHNIIKYRDDVVVVVSPRKECPQLFPFFRSRPVHHPRSIERRSFKSSCSVVIMMGTMKTTAVMQSLQRTISMCFQVVEKMMISTTISTAAVVVAVSAMSGLVDRFVSSQIVLRGLVSIPFFREAIAAIAMSESSSTTTT